MFTKGVPNTHFKCFKACKMNLQICKPQSCGSSKDRAAYCARYALILSNSGIWRCGICPFDIKLADFFTQRDLKPPGIKKKLVGMGFLCHILTYVNVTRRCASRPDLAVRDTRKFPPPPYFGPIFAALEGGGGNSQESIVPSREKIPGGGHFSSGAPM